MPRQIDWLGEDANAAVNVDPHWSLDNLLPVPFNKYIIRELKNEGIEDL